MRWVVYVWAHAARAVRVAQWQASLAFARGCLYFAAGSRLAPSVADVEVAAATRRAEIGRRFEATLMGIHPRGPRGYARWLRSGRRHVPDPLVSWTTPEQPIVVSGWNDPIATTTYVAWLGTQDGAPLPAPDFDTPEGERRR